MAIHVKTVKYQSLSHTYKLQNVGNTLHLPIIITDFYVFVLILPRLACLFSYLFFFYLRLHQTCPLAKWRSMYSVMIIDCFHARPTLL